MDTDAFLAAMAQVRSAFPAVRRFAAYGSVFSLADKTADDLLKLKAAGLRTVYLGLESGDEETLRRVGNTWQRRAWPGYAAAWSRPA